MNKITVIQLLNKIANGEEVPKKFKYHSYIYSWCCPCEIYEAKDEEGKDFNLYDYFASEGSLNDEIEIIEEDKEIEEVPFNNGMKEYIDVYHELEHYNYKINEIRIAVNELRKGK